MSENSEHVEIPQVETSEEKQTQDESRANSVKKK